MSKVWKTIGFTFSGLLGVVFRGIFSGVVESMGITANDMTDISSEPSTTGKEETSQQAEEETDQSIILPMKARHNSFSTTSQRCAYRIKWISPLKEYNPLKYTQVPEE